MILIAMDLQKYLTNMELYNYDLFIKNTKKIINTSRANGIEIVYVQHDDGIGSRFSRGDELFEIDDEFAPVEGEKVIVKNVSSAFCGTDLKQYIEDKHENTVIIVGLLTNFCMDATVKAAFEIGLNVIIPEGTNTTFDNIYMDKETCYKYYNEYMWPNRFAKCVSIQEAISLITTEF